MPYLYLRIAPVRTSSILSSGAVPHSKGISVSYKSISNPSASSYGSPLSLPLSLSLWPNPLLLDLFPPEPQDGTGLLPP